MRCYWCSKGDKQVEIRNLHSIQLHTSYSESGFIESFAFNVCAFRSHIPRVKMKRNIRIKKNRKVHVVHASSIIQQYLVDMRVC
jgi:hypothetical protein